MPKNQIDVDYLVPSLREWLTRKQRETRRGRAELRLAELTEIWNANQELRLLPPLWEFAKIHLLTNRRNWTEPQRKMMTRSGRVGALVIGLVALAVIVGSTVVYTLMKYAMQPVE